MENFVKDILEVLKKHGYKSSGVQQLVMDFDVDRVPVIHIEYLHVDKKT